jgi:hypothetical protein
MRQQEAFFDFLQFCIGSVEKIPASIKEADWKVLYAIAKKQALTGVLFHGIKQLPKELVPDAGLLMQWMAMAQKIRQQNIQLFLDSAKVCKKFKRVGIPTSCAELSDTFDNAFFKSEEDRAFKPA